MYKKSIFGLADNETHANRVVEKLNQANFTNISVLYADRKSGEDFEYEAVGSTTIRKMTANDTNFSNQPFNETRKSTNYRPVESTKKTPTGKLGHEKHTKAPEGGVTGAATGGLIGGSLGLLAGIGALAIPGLGPFIAAGPIMAALSGSAIGGSVGLVVGALAGLGMPEYEAKKYQNSLETGHVLICVHLANSKQEEQAKQLLKQEGVKDIAVSSDKK